jgi:hypothetical protein
MKGYNVKKADPLSPQVCICHVMAGCIVMKLVSLPLSLVTNQTSPMG